MINLSDNLLALLGDASEEVDDTVWARCGNCGWAGSIRSHCPNCGTEI